MRGVLGWNAEVVNSKKEAIDRAREYLDESGEEYVYIYKYDSLCTWFTVGYGDFDGHHIKLKRGE